MALQEELDWLSYRLYGLLSEPPLHAAESLPPLRPGERAFAIVLARQAQAGELSTVWFERHGITPVTELPGHWPASYRHVVEERINLIDSQRDIALLEQAHHKRRWQREPWEAKEQRALQNWLLDRLETPRYWPQPELTTCARLADLARRWSAGRGGTSSSRPRPRRSRPTTWIARSRTAGRRGRCWGCWPASKSSFPG